MPEVLVRINAAGIVDAQGTAAAPASLLLRLAGGRAADTLLAGRAQCLGVGTPTAIDTLLNERFSGEPLAHTIDRPKAILIPGLVNAHTHLDLTHIGPQPFDPAAGFASFIKVVLANRLADPQAIARSVQLGVKLSLRGGVVAVGDIGGVARGKPSFAPFQALANAGMNGVSFLEFFAVGTGEATNLQELEATLAHIRGTPGSPPFQHGVMLGLSPHAPYTVGPRAYEQALALAAAKGLQVSTHVAETPEERQFLTQGTGPFRDFLERIALWGGDCDGWASKASSPLAHMTPLLRRTPMLLAHVNDCDDEGLQTLVATDTRVAYCPRSSDYFKNHEHFGPHRYRDMLARGLTVALGTDSVINLPPDPRDPTLPKGARLSTLDEARFLSQRDATDPRQLLAMATIHGAHALGLDARAFGFTPGFLCAGVVAVPAQDAGDPSNLARLVMAGTSPPELLLLGKTPAQQTDASLA